MRAKRAGLADPKHKFDLTEMARGNVMFAATGVTDGAMLRGVHRSPGAAVTHSMVMRSTTGTLRYIEAHHDLNRKLGCG